MPEVTEFITVKSMIIFLYLFTSLRREFLNETLYIKGLKSDRLKNLDQKKNIIVGRVSS